MYDPREPAHQLKPGPVYARDYIGRNLSHLISSSPQTVEDMRKTYGRYLSGFGSEDMSGAAGYDARYQEQHTYDLEAEDDNFGSGIFDESGRGGTSNSDMGIFAGHYAWPGYLAREVPFTVSRDVTDITDDAAVVAVPGGGMFYVEKDGRLGGAAVTGPVNRPPQIEPAADTTYDQVYVGLVRKGREGHELFPGAPTTSPVPRRRPVRGRTEMYRVPGIPAGHDVPEKPHQTRIGTQSIVHATQTPVAIDRYARTVARAAPDLPSEPNVGFVDTFNTDVQSVPVPTQNAMITRPLAGFGAPPLYRDTPAAYSPLQHIQRAPSTMTPSYMTSYRPRSPGGVFGDDPPEEKKPATAMQLAFAGLLVGAGVGLVWSALGKK